MIGQGRASSLCSWALGAALALVAAAASAGHGQTFAPVEVSLVDDSGRPFRSYPAAAAGRTSRTYVEAERGAGYAIRVRNRSGERLGLVIAVDGRNILSGARSRLDERERMYVLEPWQEATYRGWRTGRDWVNAFYFTDAADAYASAWGDSAGLGVVALAAYAERVQRPRRHDERDQAKRRDRGPGILSHPGTGFGDTEWSASRTVDFRPQSTPLARHFIKYEWAETLCRRGLGGCRPQHRPDPYWRQPWSEPGYAPPPPPRWDR